MKEISDWLEEKFKEEEFKDCFLIDLKHFKDNQLKIFIDSDTAFTSGMCVRITKGLRNYLEESGVLGTNYSLEVSSPGLDRPLQIKRQYYKNIGRTLIVVTQDDERIEGELLSVDENQIELEVKTKKERRQHEVLFDEIRKAKIKISFNKKGNKK